MKIECVREKLLEALIKADRITSKNPTLNVLSSVVIGAGDNQLVIKATNLEVGLEITIPIKVIEQGICALNASVLAAFIGNIPHEKNVILELVEGVLKVTCGNHKASIKTVSYEDFPSLPSSHDNQVQIPLNDFISGLTSVWYSASVSSIKPELSSVYVFNEEDYVVFVATDSFRLAEKKIRLKKPAGEIDLLIPHKNILDLIKVFDGEGGVLNLSFDKNQLSCSLDNIYFTTRLVDGTFVDYHKIIPDSYNTEVVILKDDLVQAIRMMKVFSDKFNQISIMVNGPKNSCEFISKNNDIGEGTYTTPAKVTGETISLNFNHKYLSDGLSSIAGESVSLKFNGPGKPLLIQGNNDNHFTYLVMPNR